MRILITKEVRKIGNRIGNGFLGSSTITTSEANEEIIPSPPVEWSKGYSVYKLNFNNANDCTVSINGGDPILLVANERFKTDSEDAVITSFVIQESGVNYSWVGFY